MEIMIVLFIIGIVIAFGVPQYTRALDKTNEKNAMQQLMALQAANFTYLAQTDAFLPGAGLLIDAINNGLETNLIANGFTYSYTDTTTTADTFVATAAWNGTPSYTVQIDQTPINQNTGTENPCCSAGVCPTLPACSP